MIMIITLKEYDRLIIKENRNLDEKIISKEDAVALQSIIMGGEPIFKWGYRCLVAQHWVGTISLPGFTIEILPKLYGYIPEEMLREILTRMILVSHAGSAVKKLPGTTTIKANSLIDILIDIFLDSIEKYLSKGLQCSYQKINKNIRKIKGRILFNKQFTANVLKPTMFWCRYSKFTADNEMNRFFRCCLKKMNTSTGDLQNKHRIKYLLNYFFNITDISKEQALNEKIEFNSVNSHAQRPYFYGRLFLENMFGTLNAGNIAINSMLFDMNKVYEMFVYKIARLSYGKHVIYQASGNYLIQRKSDNKKFINMRPDITIMNDDGTYTLIDTKWKIPKKFSAESDMYQMNAYSTGIKSVRNIYVLYPRVRDIDFLGDYLFVDKSGMERPLSLRVIDLTGCLNLKKFISDFKSIFV